MTWVSLESKSGTPTGTCSTRQSPGGHPRYSIVTSAPRIRKQHGEPIYTQAVIVGWSYLEVLIEDLAVGAIVADPNLLSGEAFKKVKWRASAGTEMDVTERAAVAVATLERRTSIQSGVPRFEVILEAVGLGGQPPPEVERPLIEMMNIRHVLLHRGGRADRRLLENCDWLDLQIGDRVVIDDQACVGYHSVLSLYGVSLQGRFAKSTCRALNHDAPMVTGRCCGIVGDPRRSGRSMMGSWTDPRCDQATSPRSLIADRAHPGSAPDDIRHRKVGRSALQIPRRNRDPSTMTPEELSA